MSRELYITRDIDKDGATELTQAIKYFESQGSDPIKFYINCYGGSVPALLTILDAMENCKCEIITVNIGEADSAAALIFAAGAKGKRFITRNSRIMLHEIVYNRIYELEPLSRVEADIKEIQILQDRIWTELANFTGKNKDSIIADCKGKDFYLSAEEAIEYGLADAIITQEIREKYELKKAEIKAAAEGGTPQNKTKEQKPMKLEELLNALKTEHKIDVKATQEELSNVKENNAVLTKKVDELTAANAKLVADNQSAEEAKNKAVEELSNMKKETYFEKLVAEKKEFPAQKEAVLNHFKSVEEMEQFYAQRPAMLSDKAKGADGLETNHFDEATTSLINKKLISEEDANKYLKESK